MKRLKRNVHLISGFNKFNKNQQQQIKKHLDGDQIKFICEICSNILSKNLKIDESTLKKLSKYKDSFRALSSCGCSLKKKKKIIQRGKFLPALLASLAGSAVSTLLEKYVK